MQRFSSWKKGSATKRIFYFFQRRMIGKLGFFRQVSLPLVALLCSLVLVASTDDEAVVDTKSNGKEEQRATAPWYVWVGLVITAAVSFWNQAIVTEERFVPALSVISSELHIPNDVAGATLMAAGASSPELFSSLVSLFVTHSSLGLGTIVGSEVFNQLIICAGAVWASKSGTLQLDPVVLIREITFYAIAIVVFAIALSDTRPDPSDPSGTNHIYISFQQSFLVFIAYAVYVVVLAYTDQIVVFFKNVSSTTAATTGQLSQDANLVDKGQLVTYGSIGSSSDSIPHVDMEHIMNNLPYLHEKSITSEPSSNFKVVKLFKTAAGEPLTSFQDSERNVTGSRRQSYLATSLRSAVESIGKYSDGHSIRHIEFLMSTEKPSDVHELYDIQRNEVQGSISCFMWQRSYFYSNAYFGAHGWLLRWFTIKTHSMYSVPDRVNAEHHVLKYPKFNQIEVDEERMIIRLIASEAKVRDFYFLAPSKEVMIAAVEQMQEMINERQAISDLGGSLSQASGDGLDELLEDSDDFVSMLEFPVHGGNVEILFFVILWPLRALIHYTIPDVRGSDSSGNPKATLTGATLASVSCLIWLIIGSYAMVASLEKLADLLAIPDSVIGATVSAAGTSLPNYVASKVAANKGFGNMAVSNAFGSNTFNIMIGLGLPWVLYTSFATHFGDYTGLRDEGITASVLILAGVLLVFVVLVTLSGGKLYRWHATLFVVMYLGYLAYVVGQVYI